MLEGHSTVPYCDNTCNIKEGWICFEDPNKPCVKDCPEEEKHHGRYVAIEEVPEPVPQEPEAQEPTPEEPELELVEGRGLEPVCTLPDFDSESLGAEHFVFNNNRAKMISDVDTATVMAHTEVKGDLKLQFKLKTWAKWVEIGFATKDQKLDDYIGHDNVGFAYNVFT